MVDYNNCLCLAINVSKDAWAGSDKGMSQFSRNPGAHPFVIINNALFFYVDILNTSSLYTYYIQYIVLLEI